MTARKVVRIVATPRRIGPWKVASPALDLVVWLPGLAWRAGVAGWDVHGVHVGGWRWALPFAGWVALLAVGIDPLLAGVLTALATVGALLLGRPVGRRRAGGSRRPTIVPSEASTRTARRALTRGWEAGASAIGLTRGDEAPPKLGRVTPIPYGVAAEVDVRRCGTDLDVLASRAGALRTTLGVRHAEIHEARPGVARIVVRDGDALAATIPALPVPERPDYAALPVGVTADGRPWLLPLLGKHLLVVGATGAGKGSVLWSLLRALAAGIRDGVVQVWALDPKGGMELSPGRALFYRFAWQDLDAMVGLLEKAVVIMRERQERLRASGLREHVPSRDEPLIVLVVDELAALTAYGDPATRKRVAAALQMILSQGRAPGVLVVAAMQDPDKDNLPYRGLFPVRIALRLMEDVEVNMVLGKGARERGARCDLIPLSLPGVGYVRVEGRPTPLRVRAAYVTDDDIAATCRAYAPNATSLRKDTR